jgi:hypothetical protein
MKEEKEMEICQICFDEYLTENTKDHQCPDNWSCGACGEICEIEDGEVFLNLGFKEFVHKPELCPAQDEICEVCKETVTQCDCNRCEDCGTIYSAEDTAENLNEDGNCANCANEQGE